MKCSLLEIAFSGTYSYIFTSDQLPKIVNCPYWVLALAYFDYLLTVVRYVQLKKSFVNAKCLGGPSPEQRQLSLLCTNDQAVAVVYLFIY